MNGNRVAALARTTQSKETIMHREPFPPPHYLKHVRPRLQSGAMPPLIRGVLAVLLLATAAAPAFAGTPDHRRDAGRGEQQEQELRAVGKRDSKRKTVKKTFARREAIAIPPTGNNSSKGPADPYPSAINVNGFKQGKITDLNLTLRGLSHEISRDINVLLVAPDGRGAFLMGDVGDLPGVEDLTMTLDDEAATPLPLEEALTSGSFQPLDLSDIFQGGVDVEEFPAPAPAQIDDLALSTFDGSNPNGQWRLFLLDDGPNNTGTLSDGWTLTIKAKAKVKNKTNKNGNKDKNQREH